MKKVGLVAGVLALAVAIIPLLPQLAPRVDAQTLPTVGVQRLWVAESANVDDRGRPLSECEGQYRFDPGPKARMRAGCASGDPALAGATLRLRHINGETGAITDVTTITLDAVGNASLDARTPVSSVPFITTDSDVIQLINVATGEVVMTGGWELP